MNECVMDPRLALQFRDVFSQLNWVNLNFGDSPKKSLLARLSPRIDTSQEVVMISTPVDRGNNWLSKVEVNGETLPKASLLITDRRFVAVTNTQIHEFPYSELRTWQRHSALGDLPYQIYTRNNRSLRFYIRAGGAGLFAAVVGLWDPFARADAIAGSRRASSIMELMDRFMSSVLTAAQGTVL